MARPFVKKSYSFGDIILLTAAYLIGAAVGLWVFMTSTPALYGMMAGLGIGFLAMLVPVSPIVLAIPALKAIATSTTVMGLIGSSASLALNFGAAFATAASLVQAISRYVLRYNNPSDHSGLMSKARAGFEKVKAATRNIDEALYPEILASAKATPLSRAIYKGMKATDTVCEELQLPRQYFETPPTRGLFTGYKPTEAGKVCLATAYLCNGNTDAAELALSPDFKGTKL